ncbi:MAG: hypothetical protein HN909_00025 [Phycisphaerales bacterium]|jgi:hypothetical protein|nr:hypothetical protein [Phycisphaerales bacterium]MBT7170138.1 hypothetical protein [Phycisphaerales bacterium]
MLNDWVSSRFEALFQREGLIGFDAWYTTDRGSLLQRSSRRDVSILTFDDEGTERTFFLKRFHRPHIKDMWFAFQNSLRIMSQAEFERSNSDLLRTLGVGSLRPVMVGSRFLGAIERCSILLTEQLESIQLPEYVITHWDTMPPERRQVLLRAMGKTVRKLHNGRVSFPDLYAWHFFVREQGDSFDFDLIDLHRMGRRMLFPGYIPDNLGTLLFSMPQSIFTLDDTSAILDGYFEGDPSSRRAALMPAIHRQTMKLLRRRPGSIDHKWNL